MQRVRLHQEDVDDDPTVFKVGLERPYFPSPLAGDTTTGGANEGCTVGVVSLEALLVLPGLLEAVVDVSFKMVHP